MKSIAELKDQEQTDCPLLLFDCELGGGQVERWSTHAVRFNGEDYAARVLKHSDFVLRAGAVDGIDGAAKVTVTLANADGRLSELDNSVGWKGSKVIVRFAFFDLEAGSPTTEASVIFLGIANPPDEITESTFRLTFANRMSLQRLQLPDVRLERRCPWIFPSTPDQRVEATAGGDRGRYSPFYRCGYSAGTINGAGQLNNGQPYSSCGFTRTDCEARGMFGDPLRRFGGIEYLPSTIDVRSYGVKGSHASAPIENIARYDDFVPLVYGTVWYSPVIIFARNDGNLTRLEVLLGLGQMHGVLKVLVNGVEVPAGVAGQDMTATGWFNITATGDRSGAFNPDFPDGDPYGSMCVLAVVLPSRIADGTTLPKIQVLAQGKLLESFGTDGGSLGDSFTNNPAWVILDVLRRAGWTREEVDTNSFAVVAAYCDERMTTVDVNGNYATAPRYQCNLALTKRRSAGDVVRGIRAGAGLYLTFGPDGRLVLQAEASLSVQQPVKAVTSNSSGAMANGWPAYEFGDGNHGFGGILCSDNGIPSIRFWSRSSAETPNRLSIEFQDEQNEYQQDSLSVVDSDDVLATGQEINGSLTALGIPNFGQAIRVLRRQLNRSVRGNRYVDFETSVKGIGLRPGEIISLTYLRASMDRQLFRIVSIAPGSNYRTVKITAQLHDDAWYSDDTETSSSAQRQPGTVVGIPRPIAGAVTFRERSSIGADGSIRLSLTAEFARPISTDSAVAGVPLIALSATVDTDGGTIAGGRALYYAVTAVDSAGNESALSFTATARTAASSESNRVTLTGLSFPRLANSFHVYRGSNPWVLVRIASTVPLGGSFEDGGLPDGSQGPPDNSYDHANIYWRLQKQPQTPVTSASATSISSSSLHTAANDFRSMVLRISTGPGAGQERAIISNSEQEVIINPEWVVIPTVESQFTISESGWRFGASTAGNAAEFDIPNEPGVNLEVSLRSANVSERECAYELSPLNIWTVGGAGSGDIDVAGLPKFNLRPNGRGLLELYSVGFDSPANTKSVQAGTLGLHYRDELDGLPQASLSAAIGPTDEKISITSANAAKVNDLLQIGAEVLRIVGIESAGASCQVTRGMYNTAAAAGAVGAAVIYLKQKVVTLGFPRQFFSSTAAGNYSYSVDLPSSRLAAATLFVMNDQGNSPTGWQTYTTLAGGGLRTYGGGQLSLQVPGMLAIKANATPPLVIQDGTSVRDVFATVSQAATDSDIGIEVTVNGSVFCSLTIPAHGCSSDIVSGFTLPPLPAKGTLGLSITRVTQSAGVQPGSDLTVTIRL